MDNSQSSDIFSVNTSFSCNDNEPMDTGTYEALLVNTKKYLSKDVQIQVKNICFYDNFSALLEDCSICINQSLDLIISLLESEEVSINSVCEYINNCVTLLQLMSNFIKNVVECVSMTCQSMKTFPLTTAQIIFIIFKHCKNSETLYGCNLAGVQTQLKDIFRSCHELQLTYLMLLDKHFVFDLSEAEEMEIFLQALDINLKIGELVQSLDVKTMAEQWKGISLLCEKYAVSLVDKQVFGNCSSILCKIVDNNLEVAVQIYQEDKVIMRSLKVSCFALKILMKLSNTLKHSVIREYKDVLETLCQIYLQNPAFLKINNMPASLASLIKTHVGNPADAFLQDLVFDEQFKNCILQYDWIQIKRDSKFIGFVLLLTNVIKLWLQLKLEKQVNTKDTYNIRLIKVLMSCVPFCQYWFNKQTEFSLNNICLEPCGFYKYILINTYSLCLTLNGKQYLELEQSFYEAVMSIESASALFASNLWILLARKTVHDTTISQIITLLKTYQKLEKNVLFCNSPQEVHLRFILKQLFEILDLESRMTIYKEFNINADINASIWAILEIKKLPFQYAVQQEIIIFDQFRMKSRMLSSEQSEDYVEDITDLIKITNLASTCENHNDVEPVILQLWMKMCPKSGFISLNKEIDKSNLWYFQLFQALIMLTFSHEQCVWRTTDLIKIIHVLSAVIDTENVQLSLLATDAFYKLAQYKAIENQDVYPLFHKTVSNILNDDTLASKLVNKLKGTEKKLFLSIVAKDESNSQRLVKLLSNDGAYKDHEDTILQINFKHKCMDNPVTEITKAKSSNFEFDIDSILDTDNSEPKCKKQKTQNEDIDVILTEIENKTSTLQMYTSELSVKDKMRIKIICNNLNSIINLE